MASDKQKIFKELQLAEREPQVADADKTLDARVEEIFVQARDHRNLLIKFYVWYTAVLSGLVVTLIFWQAAARFFVYGDQHIELIPQWALNIIITGMFGQFIGLLTIVTKRVWEFKSFFDHAKNNHINRKE